MMVFETSVEIPMAGLQLRPPNDRTAADINAAVTASAPVTIKKASFMNLNKVAGVLVKKPHVDLPGNIMKKPAANIIAKKPASGALSW